jgi:hypothetical protein
MSSPKTGRPHLPSYSPEVRGHTTTAREKRTCWGLPSSTMSGWMIDTSFAA